MTGRRLCILLPLTVALIIATPPAWGAPKEASSRMRAIEGRLDTLVPAATESVILDTITVVALRHGYALVESDKDELRIRFEKPATQGEAATLVPNGDGSERKRLAFEVVANRSPAGTLKVIGAMTLVTQSGSTAQSDVDVGKRQPFRNELKALLAEIKGAFRKPK